MRSAPSLLALLMSATSCAAPSGSVVFEVVAPDLPADLQGGLVIDWVGREDGLRSVRCEAGAFGAVDWTLTARDDELLHGVSLSVTVADYQGPGDYERGRAGPALDLRWTLEGVVEQVGTAEGGTCSITVLESSRSGRFACTELPWSRSDGSFAVADVLGRFGCGVLERPYDDEED